MHRRDTDIKSICLVLQKNQHWTDVRESELAAYVVVLDLGLCCTYPHLIGLAAAP